MNKNNLIKRIIVEGKDDEALINCLINKFIPDSKLEIRLLDGCDSTKLKKGIEENFKSVKKSNNLNLAIILDCDDDGDEKIKRVNEAIQLAFKDEDIELSFFQNQNSTIKFDYQDYIFTLSLFLIGVNGKGELEDILKEIKCINSPYADCLYSWTNCLKEKNKDISEKEINKIWLEVFLKYDACTTKERNNVNKNCNLKSILEKTDKVFNLEHEAIKPLKDFLITFSAY